MIRITLYTSECTANDRYEKVIRDMVSGLTDDMSFIRITDADIIDNKGFIIPCTFGYCPGCRANYEEEKKQDPGAVTLPVLEINGEIAFCGYQADTAALEKIIRRYI